MLLKGQPVSSSKVDHFIISFPLYKTSILSPRTQMNSMTPSSKLSYPYLLTPSSMPYSIWGERFVILPILRSKRLRCTSQRGGVMILSKREQWVFWRKMMELLSIWWMDQGWSKGDGISSYSASSAWSWDRFTQQSYRTAVSLFIWR